MCYSYSTRWVVSKNICILPLWKNFSFCRPNPPKRPTLEPCMVPFDSPSKMNMSLHWHFSRFRPTFRDTGPENFVKKCFGIFNMEGGVPENSSLYQKMCLYLINMCTKARCPTISRFPAIVENNFEFGALYRRPLET